MTVTLMGILEDRRSETPDTPLSTFSARYSVARETPTVSAMAWSVC